MGAQRMGDHAQRGGGVEDDGRVAPGDIRSFYESMVRVLPCAECCRHAIAYLGRHPVPLTSKGDLCRWVWQFHNAVNVRTSASDRCATGPGNRRRRRSPRVAMLVATALALLLVISALPRRHSLAT